MGKIRHKKIIEMLEVMKAEKSIWTADEITERIITFVGSDLKRTVKPVIAHINQFNLIEEVPNGFRIK